MPTRRLERYLKKNGIDRLEDLLIKIGRGDRLASIVADGLISSRSRRRSDSGDAEILTVGDVRGAIVSYAKCCYPIPGHDIMGYMYAGNGLVIHRLQCQDDPE